MSSSTYDHDLSAVNSHPTTEDNIRLLGGDTFESIEDRFPPTISLNLRSAPAKPERIGPYIIETELGRGGMGIVYRARDIRLGRTIALKMILRANYSDPKDLHRFQVEATAVAKLQHPNIVQVYDVGMDGDVPYMALEFVDQGTLSKKLQGKPQESRFAASLVAGMADGIQHAHDHGILHRDLKPANILLRKKEVDSSSSHASSASHQAITEVPVVSDFGLAKKLDSKELFTQSGLAIGTPNYMSPEQASGQTEKVGPASDIYGLGAILYELLTGHPPFQGISTVDTLMQVMQHEPVPPRDLQPKIAVDLETICLKCLQKEPHRRYATAGELAADLRRFLNDEVIHARAAGPVERMTRWCRRHPAVTGLLALVFLLLTTGVTISSTFAFKAQQRAEQLAVEKDKAARNLQRARTIIREYLTDVDEDPQLAQSLSIPLKQKLLSRAMPMLKELMRESGDSPDLLAEEAKAHCLLGNIHMTMGETQDAEKAYLASIQSWKKLQNQQTLTNHHLEFLGSSYLNLGKLQFSQGRFDEALASKKETLTQANAMQADKETDDRKRGLMIQAHLEISNVFRQQGKYADAQTSIRQAKELTSKREDFHLPRFYLINAINVMGDEALLAYETGRCAEAIAIHTKVQALSDERYKLEHHEEEYLKQLAHTNHQLSRVLEKTGQWEEAIRMLTIAIEKTNQLIAKNPLSHLYQQNLAVSYGNRGLIYGTINKITEAEADIRQELKLMEQLVKTNPTFANRRELARSHGHLGHILFNRKQFTVGEQELFESIKQFNQLLQLQPGEIEVRMLTANTHMTLGSIHFTQRVIEKAIQSHTQAYEEFSTLVKLCPQHTLHRILLGGACCNLGLNHMVSNQLDAADKWLNQADGHLTTALKEEPGDSTAQTFSRNTMFARAGVLYLRGNSREAVALINRVWKMPMREHEVKDLEQFCGEIHDHQLAQARQAVDKNDWTTVHEIVSLLAASERVSVARQLELLKLCNQGLVAKAKPDFAPSAVKLVTLLNQQNHFKNPKQLQIFQTEAGLAQVRQLSDVSAILDASKPSR
jgi:serine/threonine protein kinase/tetratricopeptide (TPR) repeat protein